MPTVNVREERIELTAIDKGADAVVKQLTGSVESLRSSYDQLASTVKILAGGVGIGYFVSLVKGSIDAAARLEDLSKSTSLTVTQLAGLSLLGKQTGTDIEGLAKGIERMSVAMGKDPGRFAALGVTVKDNLEAFKQLADIFNLLPDVQQRNALAQAVFNKSWAELAPALSLGSQQIGEVIEHGTKLSGVTEEMTQQAKAFNDKWVELTGTGGLLTRLIGPMLPLLNVLADGMLKATEKADGMNTSFKPMAETLKALIILGANVSFVFETLGKDIARAVENVKLIAKGDFTGSRALGEMFRKDAAAARAALDAYEKTIMGTGLTGKPALSASAIDPAAAAAATERAKIFLANKEKEIYAARVAAIHGTAATYIAEIKTQETLADLAFKEGGINNQRTQEALILQQSALADEKLRAQLDEYTKLEALAKAQGKPKDVEANAALIIQTNAAIAANETITQARIRAERTITAQQQLDQYNAWAGGLEQQGAALVASFGSEAEITNKAYADKLQALEVYLAANRDQITNANDLRLRLELEHQAALGKASAQGALQRAALEKMTLTQQASFYFGTLASITAAGAQHSKELFLLNKVAGIANTIISTQAGMAKALEWGWPLGPIFAGIIAAAGAANVAVIAGTQFGSGSSAPSIGGGTAVPTTPAAGSPVPPAAPSGPATVINLHGETFSRDQLIELFERINEHLVDGGKITIA